MLRRARFAACSLTLAALAPAPCAQTPASIPVHVDRRVELLSIVFRLAGSPEYSQGRLPGYAKAVDEHFAPFRDHAVVKRARALRASRGISYDAVASFAIHLQGIDPPRFADPDHRPARLEARWTTADANAFLADLAAFVEQAKVAEFFAGQRELYALAEKQMQEIAADNVDMTWFAKFFGERPKARFQVVLGLLNGGGNYGPSALAADGSEDLYAILGCWTVDAAGLPNYDKTIVPTLIHEYCHSYCNPIVDEHYASLAKGGDALYGMTAAAMQSQAYGNGRTLLAESLVRACVVRYRAAVEGKAAAAAETKEQNRCSFLWVGDLADLLAERYEGDRTTFPTLHAFGTPLGEFFTAAATRLAAQVAKAPKVAALVPQSGATDVDPALPAMVITFDRPMRDQSWSVVGGGEHFPELIGKPSFDATHRILTLHVKLKPDWSYDLWLNRGKFDSFRSEDGTPLQPVHVTFSTRSQ